MLQNGILVCRENDEIWTYADASQVVTDTPGKAKMMPKSCRSFEGFFCRNLISISLASCGISEIPLIKTLKKIDCTCCDNLQRIYIPESLKHFRVDSCHSLTEIIFPKKPMILEKEEGIGGLYFSCDNCPWIWYDNQKYSENLKKLRVLQIFCRTIRVRKLLRLSRTKKFCEFFYHPENYGGRWAKASLVKFTEKI